jgi:hypothetical protein
LLAGLIALAMGLVTIGTPVKVAQADTPAPQANLLVVHKHCVPIGAAATFDVTFNVDFTSNNGPLPPVETGDDPDPNTAFDVTFPINCGDEATGGDDGDTVTLGDGTGDIDLAALFDWYEANQGSVGSALAQITEATVPGVMTIYDSNFGPDAECSWDETNIPNFADPGIWCLITNDGIDAANITVTKVFTGEPADQAFTFTLDIDDTATEECAISVDGGPLSGLGDGETFDLANGQTASLTCPPGTHTVTETPAMDIPLTALDCTFTPETAGSSDLAAGSFTVTIGSVPTTADCTFTNGGEVEDGLDIIVKKECVGVDGTFTFNLGGAATELTADIECGDSFTFEDLEPGEYTIDEVVDDAGGDDGDDGEDPCEACDPCADPCADEDGTVDTIIACSDLQQVDGTSVTVELVDVDIFCVFINSDEDLGDVVCSCHCGSLCLDLEIDNNNTNTIGIDNSNTNNNANNNDNDNINDNKNENENNNENHNEQNQENTQDQNNSNTQENNIDSSPEVNIDFGNGHLKKD